MANATKSITTQAKIQEIKMIFEGVCHRSGPGGSFLGWMESVRFDDISRDISTLENRTQGLEANLNAARKENALLTQELEQRRAAEDIPFGAVEADPEVARLEREVAELQLLLETRTDELAVYKHAMAHLTRTGQATTFAHAFRGVTGLSTLTRKE